MTDMYPSGAGAGDGGGLVGDERSSGGFAHLEAWVQEATELITSGLAMLREGELDLPDGFAEVVVAADDDLIRACHADRNAVIDRLRAAGDETNFDADAAAHRQALVEHGLAADDPGWLFKQQVYRTLAGRYGQIWDGWSQFSLKEKFKKLRGFRRLLSAINGILKSIASAVGAGGALVEIKDAYETVLGEAEDHIADQLDE